MSSINNIKNIYQIFVIIFQLIGILSTHCNNRNNKFFTSNLDLYCCMDGINYFEKNLDFKTSYLQTELKEKFGVIDVYIINLERRPDRLNLMKEQLDQLGIPFTTFSGIDGKDLAISNNYYRRSLLHSESKPNVAQLIKSKYKLGELGCWLSHLHLLFLILKKAKTTGIDGPVLKFADDVVLEKSFTASMKQALIDVPKDWDMLFLGTCGYPRCITTIINNICRAVNIECAQAVIFRNSNVIEKLIKITNIPLINIAVDEIWKKHLMKPDLKAYRLIPDIAVQDRKNYGSDIRENAHHWGPHIKLKNPFKELVL